jgi:hypothetical protein
VQTGTGSVHSVDVADPPQSTETISEHVEHFFTVQASELQDFLCDPLSSTCLSCADAKRAQDPSARLTRQIRPSSTESISEHVGHFFTVQASEVECAF